MLVGKVQYKHPKESIQVLNRLLQECQQKLTRDLLEQHKFTPHKIVFRTANSCRNTYRPHSSQGSYSGWTRPCQAFGRDGASTRARLSSSKTHKPNSPNGMLIRSKSTHSPARLSQLAQTEEKTNQQKRKQKMISILSMQNLRKQLINTRKLSAFHSIQKCQKMGLHQVKPRFAVQNAKKKPKVGESQGVREKPRKSQQNNLELVDLQMHYKSQLTLRQAQVSSTEVSHRQFLKKGSNLQRSIFNSLLKQKLGKLPSEQANNYLDFETDLNSEEVIKLIKVFKGKFNNRHSKKVVFDCLDNKPKEKHHQLIDIEAWQNETQEQQIQASPPKRLIHASNSSQL